MGVTRSSVAGGVGSLDPLWVGWGPWVICRWGGGLWDLCRLGGIPGSSMGGVPRSSEGGVGVTRSSVSWVGITGWVLGGYPR